MVADLDTSPCRVYRVRRWYAEGDRTAFRTTPPPQANRYRNLDDRAEAGLIVLACSDAPVIRVVLDNLNTHRMASLYETFPADEARRIVKRLEFTTPPSMPVGSTWRRLDSACSAEPASKEETRTPTPCNVPSPLWKRGATPRASRPTGDPVPTTPEPNSIPSIPAFPRLTEY